MQQRTGHGREEAARRVQITDHDRTNFVRDHFRKDPADPTLYDLILNTSRYTLDECAELFEQALRCFQLRKPARAGNAAAAGG